MTGKMVRGVIALALLFVACSNNKSLINEDDPFDDPFFSDGLGNGTRSLDEILREPSPSVGWLAREGAVPPSRSSRSGGSGVTSGPDEEGVLLEAENADGYPPPGAGEDEQDEDSLRASNEKSFYDQASEATLATMSILVGAGMAALPFLIGT